MVLLASGALLIIFNNWINKSKIEIGFETLNKTLMPVYIGIVFAFLLGPIYNSVVKHSYRFLSSSNGIASRPSPVGPSAFLAAKYIDVPEEELNRRNLSFARVIATLACLGILIGSVALIAYFVIPQVIDSSVTLATTLPQKLPAFSAWLTSTFSRFPAAAERIDQITNASANEVLHWIQMHVLNDDTMTLATTISESIFSIIGVLVNIVIGLLIMVYLLNNKDRIFAIGRKLIAAIFSERRSNSIYEFTGIINDTFLNFITGRIMDSVIIGILTYIVLVVCNISFAPMISVLIGVTNVIPFFGPFIGAIPSALILLIEDPMQALYFIVIILLIQQLDGNVIGPKIVGNAIGISSFWVLISVLIGGGLFGFLGMALGVPVFAVIYIYVNKLAIRSLEKKNLGTVTDDYFTLEQYDIVTSEVALKKPAENRKRRKKILKHLEKAAEAKAQVEQGANDIEDVIEESMLIDTSEKEG